MSKRESEKGAATPRRVNVEIAPGNRNRLLAYIRAYNEDPDRRHPSMNMTDALNAALDEFLSQELSSLQPPPLPTEPDRPKTAKRPSRKEE